ncbi:general transcription factor 3C polypeptide 3 isoform X2 [Cephus cinctus]|nr:general transcription factor 3C polypeptide 3 isoform X2 [Cephus cinctus]
MLCSILNGFTKCRSTCKMDIEDSSEDTINMGEARAEIPMLLNENTSLAPVIIEELDEHAITSMNVDMGEFIEAEALKVHEVNEEIALSNTNSETYHSGSAGENMSDTEEQDSLAAAEEDKLTKQFLNGELTFSEYSLKMDYAVDPEALESETSRKAFESELASSKRIGKNRFQRSANESSIRQKRKKRILPPALQGLMGEANVRFARGETQLAAQMCMEIIRQIPSAPEPFQTLSMIYENDQPDKSLQFSLIAAHLSPRDADQWIRLASQSLESGNIKQAITCYTKAIQANPKDVGVYDLRANLQEEIGEKRSHIKGYMKLLHHLGPEDGENVVKYAKMLAKRLMQENNNEQALEAMGQVFSKCSNLVTLEEVNVMTELLIALKQFHKCLHILTKYTRIQVHYKKSNSSENVKKYNIQDWQTQNHEDKNMDHDAKKQNTEELEQDIESCQIPADVVVDLKAKLLITLIELNKVNIADQLLPELMLNEDPEVSGDLFLDIAEALMGKREFERALILLQPLVDSKNFSLAAVWLRHAECWVGCKDIKKAIQSYEIVRKLSPQHLDARLELAKLYKLKGQFTEAIEVLKQDPNVDVLDPGVVYRRTLLLRRVKKYDEYFQSGMLLLSRHCLSLRSRSELSTLTRAIGVRQRLEALKLYRLSRGETLEEENGPIFSKENEPSFRNEFLLFLQMCRLACKRKKFGLLQRMCFSALTSKKFEKKNFHIMFLCLVSCIYNNDSYYGFNMVRELVRIFPRSNVWNLLNVVVQRAEDCRHNRFIMRWLAREDPFSYLHILHANNCLVSGTYKYALNDYMSLFKAGPSALLALLIAVTLLQMACQKFAAKKNQLVIQALAFIKKYSQIRGKDCEQESNYNTARAFHQLGLLPAAVHHYKLVLESPVPEIIQRNANILDLKREAAFNLHLIYSHTENHHMARMYLENYITV